MFFGYNVFCYFDWKRILKDGKFYINTVQYGLLKIVETYCKIEILSFCQHARDTPTP
jgi:hypothetical protein